MKIHKKLTLKELQKRHAKNPQDEEDFNTVLEKAGKTSKS